MTILTLACGVCGGSVERRRIDKIGAAQERWGFVCGPNGPATTPARPAAMSCSDCSGVLRSLESPGIEVAPATPLPDGRSRLTREIEHACDACGARFVRTSGLEIERGVPQREIEEWWRLREEISSGVRTLRYEPLNRR
jgi:hypothetical protein